MGIIKRIKKSSAFTLIETIVVIGVISLVLPALFSIVFIILRQQARIFKLQKMKQEGDFVLNTIKTYVKNNAIGIFFDELLLMEVCDKKLLTQTYSSTDGNDFFFKDKTGRWFNYYLSDNKIFFRDSVINRQLIFQTCIDSFNISCQRQSAFSSPIINLSFKIYYQSCQENNEPDFVSPLTYFVSIKLKNQ